MRNRVVIIVTRLGFVLLLLGLFNLQIIRRTSFRQLSDKNRIRLLTQLGARGMITDRMGEVLVGNRLAYDVLYVFNQLTSADEPFARIAGILQTTGEELLNNYRRNYRTPSLPVVLARDIGAKKAMAIEELKSEIPGVVVQPYPLRDYPYGTLASHLLGYLNEIDHWRLTKLADYGYKTKDIVGFGGVEEKYDYYLRQDEGATSEEVDHRGRFIRVVGFKPPRNGRNVTLTLNAKMQKIAEDALVDRVGCVVMMDVRTGEVLAMASAPTFSPAAFVTRSPSYITALFSDKTSPMVNRAISGVYPAGSVFKPVVAAAALESGKITSNTSVDCAGGIRIGSAEFDCWETHGNQNLFGALARSCNVFFYRAGLLIGAPLLQEYALKLGFSRATGISIPNEASGFVPSPLWRRLHRFRSWFSGDTANLSIGQGELLVTPLQVARMMAVFANKGFLVTPYVVKAVAGQDISASQRKLVRVPLKESTIAHINQGLRRAVTDDNGTARVLADLPIALAGKTGTAQVPRGQTHAWFAGFFPFDQPRIVICVFLEHGGPGYVSCVLAKQILSELLRENLL